MNQVLDSVPLPWSVFPEPDLVTFEVAGDSMTGDDIQDGDFIVVALGREPADGDIAVVQYTMRDGRRGRLVKHVRIGLLLESSSPAYPPYILTADSDPVIEGVVVVVGVARETE